MGTECLPPCPFWVSFLHPPFKPDPKKGKICSAPRQRLRSRIPKAHLIRIHEFQRPEVPMSGELEWRVEESRSVASLGMTEGGQVLCAWPPTGFSHPWIAVFTQLKECPNVD